MKPKLTLLPFLFITLVCVLTVQTLGQTANANAAAKRQSAGTGAEADLIAKEKQVWDALKGKDFAAFANLLAEDAVEIEPDGIYDKAGTVNGVKQVDFTGVTLSDFKVVKLGNDAAVVSYLVKGTSPAFGAEGGRHSTVWMKRGGKWLAVFHQGTPVMKSSAQ